MTPEQFDTMIERLDKIVALLELQTSAPDEPKCAHEKAVDQGVYGVNRPGERMLCQDCGETFSRIAEETQNG
jgi:transposase-like protein